MIFDSNADLNYEDNVFGMLGGSVDDYVSLGTLEGIISPLTLIVYA